MTLYRQATDDDFNSPDGPRPEKNWVVPAEPDYEAMAKRMPELIDIAAFWTENNCIGLAHQLWAAGVGEETP